VVEALLKYRIGDSTAEMISFMRIPKRGFT
jgi:hypothetical protein